MSSILDSTKVNEGCLPCQLVGRIERLVDVSPIYEETHTVEVNKTYT